MSRTSFITNITTLLMSAKQKSDSSIQVKGHYSKKKLHALVESQILKTQIMSNYLSLMHLKFMESQNPCDYQQSKKDDIPASVLPLKVFNCILIQKQNYLLMKALTYTHMGP